MGELGLLDELGLFLLTLLGAIEMAKLKKKIKRYSLLVANNQYFFYLRQLKGLFQHCIYVITLSLKRILFQLCKTENIMRDSAFRHI